MPKWQSTTIGDVITLQRGFDITRAIQRSGNIPVVSSGGIGSYHDTAMAKGPGVVIGRKGTLGKVFYLPSDYWPHDTTLWVKDFKGNNPRFVYYFLQTLDFLSMDVGSSNPTLNRNHVHPISILWPSLLEQQAIASVLAALDNKIAVNDRIATTVLALCDSVFQSLVADIDAGPDTFASVADVFGGGTPRTSEASYWDGGVAWATPTDVTGLGAPYLFCTKRTITESGLDNCASRLYPAGSIFMTSRATIGAFSIPQIPAAVNQGFIVVVPPRRELRWWLFHEMRSRVDDMISLANGSTFLELSRKNFKAIPVRLGSNETIARFHEQVDALHLRAAKATYESNTLAELRDTLLPKLVSGEIRVRDAKKFVENAA